MLPNPDGTVNAKFQQFDRDDTMKRKASGAPQAQIIIAVAAALAAGAAIAMPAAAQSPPAIRLSDANRVPACATPARLMAFLRDRNPRLDSRYNDIAKWYKTHGETWRVRWDYAFFQMIIETNGLLFKTAGGRGDVSPKQNNFAGIGTTGGGVPGDGYADMSTGVLAQIQHLVAYSGERLDKPVAPRTQLKQDDIIAISSRLRRTVTFGDLAGRWAVDRRYGRSIEWVADRFRRTQCNGRNPGADEPETPAVVAAALLRSEPPRASPTSPTLVQPPVQISARQRVSLASAGLRPTIVSDAEPVRATEPTPIETACRVQSASYVGKSGNHKTLLIRAVVDAEVHFTALQVLDGFEGSMGDTFIRTRAPGGNRVATYDSAGEALARAYELCPSAK